MFAVLSAHRDLSFSEARMEGTYSHVYLLDRGFGADIEVEDIPRHTQRGAGVGYVYDASHVAQNGRASQEEIGLVIRIAKPPQILDRTCKLSMSGPVLGRRREEQAPSWSGLTETGLTISNTDVHVVLLAVVVDGETFKVDITPRTK